MLQLMEQHYEDVGPAAFEADLAEKQWVIQVRDGSGELCGFSTQMLLDAVVAGRTVKALFSGDTIIDRRHWGDRALTHAGGQLAMSLLDKWIDAELYWFLISQGFRTYRFLPVFFRDFYPRYDVPTPGAIRRVIDALAIKKFGTQYDSSAGVIRTPTYRLREGLAAERSRDPHVNFFIERNPGHAQGDELCCIARLSRDNFTEAAYRVLKSK